MSDDCCNSGDNIMILACSGGSNVGQLSNRAAVELTREGFGKMYCQKPGTAMGTAPVKSGGCCR
jgi:uncharacterized metal-binding protein